MSTVKRKVKAIMLTVDGETKVLDLSNSSYPQLKDAVGGYVQVVELSDKLNLWCNEDGKSMELPHNRYGQAIWEKYYGFSDYIVGNFVITGGCNADGGTIGLTHKQIADILLVVHEAASNGISYAVATVR